MTPDPDTDLSFTRDLAAPRTAVWACWTDPRHIPHFFIPAPHRVTACDIDLRVGGRFDTTFEVEGNVMENRGVFLEIVPRERLVFTDAYTEGWKPAPEPFMTAILDFADDGEGGTRYTATARHRTPEARRNHEEMGFFDGWGVVATQLEAYAQKLAVRM
ncbi:SRPBCC family protein [Roseivivax isoporae]|uniref:Activator of HSP90 ATPase n=1 Tax=Roseivivax isoporae LMG 25204 TaxID=1449351 RepID=X7FAX0_9RHOB|nr:SRPBCC family protein [Roseivivax isoporae]ETX29261.1 activator of HSP90 ATPase [Roseivivax isoporae LMG 25204]